MLKQAKHTYKHKCNYVLLMAESISEQFFCVIQIKYCWALKPNNVETIPNTVLIK